MQRIAFQLRLKAGVTQEYDEIHRNVWPELLVEMKKFGISQYSIFRRGQQLFLYMHVPDFDQVIRRLSTSDINQRWQQRMSPLFERVLDIEPNEMFATMPEVFFMSGSELDADLECGEQAK